MGLDIIKIKWRMVANDAGGVVIESQAPVGAPRISRPYRTGGEATSAGWAHIVQHRLNAFCAIGTFVSAYAGVCRLRRKIAIAEFAVWTQFKQFGLLMISDTS